METTTNVYRYLSTASDLPIGTPFVDGGKQKAPPEAVGAHVTKNIMKSTKKGGYAGAARKNGANKRQRAARKASRRTRNGQHL